MKHLLVLIGAIFSTICCLTFVMAIVPLVYIFSAIWYLNFSDRFFSEEDLLEEFKVHIKYRSTTGYAAYSGFGKKVEQGDCKMYHYKSWFHYIWGFKPYAVVGRFAPELKF